MYVFVLLQMFYLVYAAWVLSGTIGQLTCYAAHFLYFFSLLCSVFSMTAMNVERLICFSFVNLEQVYIIYTQN